MDASNALNWDVQYALEYRLMDAESASPRLQASGSVSPFLGLDSLKFRLRLFIWQQDLRDVVRFVHECFVVSL
jgi:hypothetical protein